MTFVPLKARVISDGRTLCVGDNGRFFAAGSGFLERLCSGAVHAGDRAFLRAEGHEVDLADPLSVTAHSYALAERLTGAGPLDYLILVPTLRCNLNCTYCQVSRVDASRPGYDWSERILAAVLARIDALPTKRLKVEFQGGEPTLRPDLIRAVIERCERFDHRQFVICTNLQEIGNEHWELFDRPDVYISTSLDGDASTHMRNRTRDGAATSGFLTNLEAVIARYGPHKVSALPTVDPSRPPDADDLLDAFEAFGLRSIFLRPINYQGFARKRHRSSIAQDSAWRIYYEAFVRKIIARNWEDRSRVLEESYLSICLRRIFQPGRDRHVDLRNPNPLGMDYVVVDHDGRVYPTDEARMLSRAGIIDLAIGDIETGWDSEARDLLNAHSSNQFDPACSRCVYQPYCGRDLVDDISRYGRIDVPRLETEFCRRHLHLYDFIFSLVYSDDEATRYSLARWLRLDGTPPALGLSLQ